MQIIINNNNNNNFMESFRHLECYVKAKAAGSGLMRQLRSSI